MLSASLHDIATRTVPNGISVALALLGVICAVTGGHLGGSTLAGGAVFVSAAFCWRRGWLGGADVKLLGAAALLLPPGTVPAFVAASAIAGGGLGFAYLVLGRFFSGPAGPRPVGLLARVLRAERWRFSRRGPLPYVCAILGGFSFVVLGAHP
jgi:prepilin peptidase CpaA